jgi:O-acetyl-ADP-ribose deacetylase (regulator of RNase III)
LIALRVPRGGSVIEDEARAQGPVEPGACVITSAGRLPAHHVIHAAVMGQDLRTSAALLGAVRTHARNATALTLVRFVLFGEAAYDAFVRAAHERGAGL